MNEQAKIQQIREILLRDWDPFCVGDNPNLSDEYDSLIAKVSTLLDSHCSFRELEQFLMKIENELDAPISDENRMKAVQSLQSIEKV